MSVTACIHDVEDNHIGNICGAAGWKYQVTVKERGARKWRPIGKPTTLRQAFTLLGQRLANDSKAFPIGRAAIWAIEHPRGYYDPEIAYEIRVR